MGKFFVLVRIGRSVCDLIPMHVIQKPSKLACMAVFSAFYKISPLNFAVLLILICSLAEVIYFPLVNAAKLSAGNVFTN